MDAVSGPILTAPALRVTRNREEFRAYLRGDLDQVRAAASQWVRQTSERELKHQIELGNSKQYLAVVDGSRVKPISQALQRVQIFFVTTILARNLGRAKNVLAAAIRRATHTHTGLLADGWEWYQQTGGKAGPVRRLGATLPPDLALHAGDGLILAPAARYAWFGNYYTARHQTFVPSEVKRKRAGKVVRRRKPARGFGFMAYAARQLRPELSKAGVSVWANTSTALAPPGTRSRFGVPILVFVVSARLRTLH